MTGLIAILISVSVSASAAPVEAPLPLDVVIERHAQRFIADKPYVATVIGVTTPAGRQVRGFGNIERDGKAIRPDGKTLYEIGSITKTMTGTLLAELQCKGVVQLDDPVQQYLPEGWSMPTRDGRQITLLHLTTHTSSLPRIPPGFDPFVALTASVNDPYSRYADENMRMTLTQVELERPIGSRFEYSNLGVGLLGQVLARAADEPDVDALFTTRLLEPLGLHDTSFDPSEEQLSRLAPPFKAEGAAGHIWHFQSLKACGGLRSTADDLLSYAEAASGRTETPLRPAFDLAMQPWRQTCEGERSIGLGWFVQPMNGGSSARSRSARGRLIWHGGATGGYRAFIGLLPECGSAIVVLSNSTDAIDPDLTQPILKAIARIHGPK